MNVLLVMPKTGYLWDEWATPPVGIAYVSAFLKKHGVNVYTLNLNLEDDSLYEVLKKNIEQNQIDLLGTGELVVNYPKIQEIAKCAKEIKPDIKIWIGGGLVTNSPYEAMELVPDADFGMIGEGELTSLELIQMLEQTHCKYMESDIENIDGIIYRKSDKTLHCTSKRQDIEDLDSLPFPDWEGFQLVETCLKYSKTDKSIVASIVSSRSCPNSCTFCSKTGGKKYRKRSLENIFLEIDELVNKYHVTKLNFNDELFADNSNRLFQFCDMIEKYNITYRVSMHIGKNLTLELLTRMRESGCRVIFYGLESADNTVLKSMRKHITIDDIEKCLKLTKQAGIIAEGNFIFGDPVETKESVQTTLNWIESNYSLGMFEVAAIKLFPGSQLYEDAVISGKINNTIKFIEDGCPLINVSCLSDEEYKYMINHDLTTIQKMRLKKRNDLALYKEKQITVTTKCSECGADITFKIEDNSHILRLYTVNCQECGALEYLNLFPTYFEKIKNNLSKLLRENNVAIFGCGNIWKMFYNADNMFKNYDYTILDETTYLQNEGWNGKNVYSPSIVEQTDIDTIIVMLRTSKLEILEKFEKQYNIHNINIIMCYDLL